MHDFDADKVITYINSLSVGGEHDYRSHQEYADVFLSALDRHIRNGGETTCDELCRILTPHARRPAWYEAAVLRDLGVLTSKGQFRPQFVKNWFVQAWALKGVTVPYNALLKIAYSWAAAEDDLYPVTLPGKVPSSLPERPMPSKPRWLSLFEQPVPEIPNEILEFTIECSKMYHAIKEEYDLRFTNYFMACHEPDLLMYNLPLLQDMYRDESPDDFDRRIQRYVDVTNRCIETCTSTKQAMVQKINTLLGSCTSMAEAATEDGRQQLQAEIDSIGMSDLF